MLRSLALIVVLGSLAIGCSPTIPPAPSGSAGDRDLANALAKQGVGQLTDKPPAPPPPTATPPTEIRQTPRGVVITFPEVLFAFNSAELTPRARREIERMAIVLTRPQVSRRPIALEGHADAIGTDTYNLDLSRRRADAVAIELIARGVHRDRVTIEAFGKRRPVAANVFPDGRDNPAGRALNRRVEAVVKTAVASVP